MNDLAVAGINIESIPSEKSVRHHASSEDLMLLIKLFNQLNYSQLIQIQQLMNIERYKKDDILNETIISFI